MTGGPGYVLRLGLGPVPVTVDDMLAEIGDRLQAYEPQLTWQGAGLELTLTVEGRDLWLAVLSAMAAVTALGYPVVELDARPAAPPKTARPHRRR